MNKLIDTAINNSTNKQVNIGGNPLDEFYRYKRDSLHFVFINQKGGQLELKNLDQIIYQLKADKKHFISYLQERIGSKISKENRVKANLSLLPSNWEQYINDYIQLYVLCPQCHYP